jgi:general secretion pathway protein K
MKPQGHHQQQGVALLMVLVIVTVIAGLMYPLWQQQQSALTRAQSSQAQLQAWAVLISAQDWVKSALKFDAEQSQTDHLLELWAQPMPAVPFDGGKVRGWLVDAQAKLNVNQLAIADVQQREQQIAIFNRLCQVLSVECPFWPAVADWMDSDDVPMSGGAESEFYMGQQPMRRAANQPLLSIDELRQVAGVTEPVLQVLNPYLTALPDATPINVNTATAPVLMALSTLLTQDLATAIIARQRTEPFERLTQVSELLRQSSVSDAELNLLVNERMMSVSTRYFMLHTQAEYLNYQWQLNSLLKRDTGRVQSLMRWLTEVEP